MTQLSPQRATFPTLQDLRLHSRGKVRDTYELSQDTLLIVASDGVSIFDFVLNAHVPQKGEILTALTVYWTLTSLCDLPNHSKSDVRSIPYKTGDPVGVVAQTTFIQKEVASILDAIRARYPDTVYVPTLCEDILWRQEELEEKAPSFDGVIIIGATISANTTHLAKMAEELVEKGLVKRSFFIPNASEFSSDALAGLRRIFVTTGASAPPSAIRSVIEKFEQIGGIRHYASA